MLENAWVIPAITFASFWLILFFGKRLPFKGSEIGLLAVGSTLVLSTVAAAQWISQKSAAVAGAEEGEHLRVAVDKSVLWFQIGGQKIYAGTHVDGLTVVMLFT